MVSMPTTRPEIPAQPANDASGVLFGLTLALTAPTHAQAATAAQLTVDIYNRSTLTADDLETLKAAAVVIANAEDEVDRERNPDTPLPIATDDCDGTLDWEERAVVKGVSE